MSDKSLQKPYKTKTIFFIINYYPSIYIVFMLVTLASTFVFVVGIGVHEYSAVLADVTVTFDISAPPAQLGALI